MAVLYLAASLARPAFGQTEGTAALPESLTRYLRTALREWDIPGAVIAVVKDGRVVLLLSHGVRERGKPGPVDQNTIFDAASLTKGFTAAAIATLVDERRMAWDDPVRQHLPALVFPDPYLTANVTIRDLLAHRTGVRATNSSWYFTGVTRSRLLGLVRHMALAVPFRTGLVYSNVGYAVVGEAAAAAAGESWEALVTGRLLVPLGMTRTTADWAGAPALGNVAAGHAMLGGVQRVTPRETTPRVATAAAGAIQSSAADLATWMLFQLGDGTFRGRRILSTEALREMHSLQVVVPTTPAFRVARQLRHVAGYGLGWQVFDYRGSPMLWHSGGGDGQSAYLTLLPEHQLGIAVLTNTLRFQYGGGEMATLEHWHHDTFRLRWATALHAEEWATFVEFRVGPLGTADGLSWSLFGDRIEAKRGR